VVKLRNNKINNQSNIKFDEVLDDKRFLKSPVIILLFISSCTLILSLVQIGYEPGGGAGWPVKIMLATLFWLVAYFTTSLLAYKTPYLFSSSYIISLAIFHLGAIYLIAIGYAESAEWVSGALSSWVELASWYILLSFSSYGIGMAIGFFTIKPKKSLNPINKEFVNRYLYQQGVGLLLASVIFLAFGIAAYGNIFAYSRQELYGAGVDSRGLRTFMMVFPGAVILMVISANSYRRKIFAYSLGFLALALFMFSGYRSAALFPALIGAVLWVKSGRKIPLPIAGASIFVVLIAISVSGQFRAMGKYGDLGAEELKKSYEGASVEKSLAEMGSSVGVLAHALRLVPDEDPYFYGNSYVKAVSGMLPNIGLKHDTSGYRGDVLADITDADALIELAPSSYMTYKLKPHQFGKGGGVGFSGIAEPYINFGTYAVVIYFVVLGALLARLDTLNLFAHPYLYLFAATMLWPLLRTVRNDFANFLKPMGFILIILIVWNIGLKILDKNIKFKN